MPERLKTAALVILISCTLATTAFVLVAMHARSQLSMQPASPPISQPSQTNTKQDITKASEHEELTFFSAVWTWAHDNREVIEPITAIGGLAVAALVCYVTYLLYGATQTLAISTGDLAKAAKEQVAEMIAARVLTESSLELGGKQLAFADRECTLEEKRHGLQREQYFAEHRPRLKIRSIGITRPDGGAMFQDGHFIEGSLVLVNIGAADATIRQAEYRFFWRMGGLPMVPPLQPQWVRPMFESMLPHTMRGHESCLIPIKSNGPLGPEAKDLLRGNPVHLYLMGAVLFSDADLKDRWMGFCQEYAIPQTSGGEGQFLPVDNPDYEYED